MAKGDEYEDIEQNCLSADSTDYLVDGNIIYKNNYFSKILFDGGFIGTNSGTGPTRPIRPVGISDGQYHQQLESWMQLDMNIYGYNFYNKDHLGNIREIVDKNGNIIQKTDYYPYGTPILFDPFTINDTSHPYKYNGKELDMMHGLNTYDYGARQYNSALPLWDRVDPLAEKYYHVSPYAYCANDPVNYVDPDGEYIKYVNNGKSYVYFNGNFYRGRRKDMTSGTWKVVGSSVKDINSPHMQRTLNALRKMDNSNNPRIKNVFDAVSNINDNYEHYITEGNKKSHTIAYDSQSSIMYINYDIVDNFKNYSDFKRIGGTDYGLHTHEMMHSYDHEFNKGIKGKDKESGINHREIRAVYLENCSREEEGLSKRVTYTDLKVPTDYEIK